MQSINILYPNKKKHDGSANNKKNRDYYEYPGLSRFMDKL